MAELSTVIKGLPLKHPILPGPGANVATAAEAIAAVQGGAAALVLQTVTMSPGAHAEPSRAPYGKDGLFHRLPCTGVGFETWFEAELLPAVQAGKAAGVPVIASVGYRSDEVAEMGARLSAAGVAAILYDTAWADRGEIRAGAQALRAAVQVPIIVRLSPHHGEDLPDLAAQLEPWADAFCLIGAFGPDLLIDVESGKSAIDAPLGIGFLSGAPIRPIAQRFVFETAKRVSKPVIAAGGAMTGRDVAEFMMLGASAVMVSTGALLKGPTIYGEMAAELSNWLDGAGYARVGEVYRAYIRKYGHGQRVVIEKEECPELLEEKCIKCTFCETVCFYDAIVAPPKTLPTISYDPCFECGLCVSACPTDALTFRPRDQVTLLPVGGE